MDASYRVDFKELDWQPVMPGIRFKAANTTGRQPRLVEYTREMKPHWCEKGHLGFVLEGELEVTFPAQTVIFNQSDGLSIPEGKEHRHMARVLGEKAVILMFQE